MDDYNQLTLLTLNIDIPDFWENELTNFFPKGSFTIINGYPCGEKAFSGLLKVENASLSRLDNFAKKIPNISLEVFHKEHNLVHFVDSDFILTPLFFKFKCFMKWPLTFNGTMKQIKIILKEKEVDAFISEIENMGLEILSFSKTRYNLHFNDILTQKQKEILEPSLTMGYYSFPKKITLNKLANKLNLSPSTLCVHLQKIESKILGKDINLEVLF